MTREEMSLRFEELDAGRALGDLDAAESAEWASLAKRLGRGADEGFDRLSAEFEAAMIPDHFTTPFASVDPSRLTKSPRRGSKFIRGPWLGWAAAACLLGLLLVDRGGTGSGSPQRASAHELRDRLIREVLDASTLSFTGTTGEFAQVTGEVVWSDERQEGYLTLSNVPPNDRNLHDYQLWIVDPARDEIPVDGGVFSVPTRGRAVIPIEAKLEVDRPVAFVITREKPGGVVRSAQRDVVAIAKR